MQVTDEVIFCRALASSVLLEDRVYNMHLQNNNVEPESKWEGKAQTGGKFYHIS